MLERLLVYDKKFNIFMDVYGREPQVMVENIGKPAHDNLKPMLQSAKTSLFTVTTTDRLPQELTNLSLSTDSSPQPKLDTRLLMGACYSMRSTLQRLQPDHTVLDGFSWDTDKWRLLYYQSPTGWKFVAVVSLSSKMVDYRHLVSFYEQLFVPAVILSPLYYRVKGEVVVGEGLAGAIRLFFAV